MKIKFIKNYLIYLVIFLASITILSYRIKIEGYLSKEKFKYIFWIILTIINFYILAKNKNNFQNKKIFTLFFILELLFLPKNLPQTIFYIQTLITTLQENIKEIILTIFCIIIVFISTLLGTISSIFKSMPYEDTHYICSNKLIEYETYAHSKGAMDKYHYYTSKSLKIIDLGDIIKVKIILSENATREKYEEFIEKYPKKYSCTYMGDEN